MGKPFKWSVEFALANRVITLGSLGVLVLMAIIAVPLLGLEFLPKLEEGNFWIRITLPTGVSPEQASRVIDTTHLIYYVSFITFGLFLTAKSVDSERWRG